MVHGRDKKVVLGAVNAEITIEVSPGVEVVAMITRASAKGLGLKEGKEAYAVVKASNGMVAID